MTAGSVSTKCYEAKDFGFTAPGDRSTVACALLRWSYAKRMPIASGDAQVTLESTAFASNIWAVTYNEFDDLVYITTRALTARAQSTASRQTTVRLCSTPARPIHQQASLCHDPEDGDIFFTQDTFVGNFDALVTELHI